MTNNPDGLSDARALLAATPHGIVCPARSSTGFCNCDHKIRAVAAALATPPASTSTAIAAGPGVTVTFGPCSHEWSQQPTTGAWTCHNCLAMRRYDDPPAAAPKAASEDGAGLREALEEIVLICEDAAYACGSCSTKCGPVKAVNETHAAATAALATPTDATDGATATVSKKEIVATTPGGDLLEQAFRDECHCAGDYPPQTHVITVEAFKRAVSRALNTAGKGEGGDADPS